MFSRISITTSTQSFWCVSHSSNSLTASSPFDHSFTMNRLSGSGSSFICIWRKRDCIRRWFDSKSIYNTLPCFVAYLPSALRPYATHKLMPVDNHDLRAFGLPANKIHPSGPNSSIIICSAWKRFASKSRALIISRFTTYSIVLFSGPVMIGSAASSCMVVCWYRLQ